MTQSFRHQIISWSLVLFLIIVALYGAYRIYPLVLGPVITVYSPLDGDTVGTSTFQISGRAERAREIKLQGRPITISTDGIFNETLVSHAPYTILVLEAVDKYGKTTTRIIKVTP